MADRRRFEFVPADHRSVDERLRREARAGRPSFSPGLHDRVVAAASARRPPAPRAHPRQPAVIVGVAAAVAGSLATVVLMAMFAGEAGRTRQLSPARDPARSSAVDVASATAVPEIDSVPTPEEITATLLDGVTTLAVSAVGLPEWADLAAFDLATLAPADHPGR